MDKTLLPLLILAIVLIALKAPYIALTLSLIVGLTVITIRGSWAIIQMFSQPGQPQRVPVEDYVDAP